MYKIFFIVHHQRLVSNESKGVAFKMRFLLRFILATTAISLFILTGCASTPKPPIAQISINVQPNINSYSIDKSEPEANPVVIRLYELTSNAAFNSNDFLSFFYDYKAALKDELLKSEEFKLIPNKKLKFNRSLHLNTQYVGVVAEFKNFEHSQWRAITAIPAKESAPEIYILLEGNKVMIGAKEACGFFCGLWSPKPPAGSLYEPIKQNTE